MQRLFGPASSRDPQFPIMRSDVGGCQKFTLFFRTAPVALVCVPDFVSLTGPDTEKYFNQAPAR